MITALGAADVWTDANRTRRIRLAGIAGILASLAWLVGDILLLGKPVASPDSHPLLNGYDGMAGLSLAAMLSASTTRLAWGALLGVLTGPLYLVACWHLYQGLRPALRLLSLPPILLLTTGFALAPFAHGSFFYWGQAAKVIDASGARSAELNALPGDLADVLFLPYAVLLTCWVLGSVWMAVCVLRCTTAFPRWMCAVNPLICIPVGALVTTLAPGSVGTAIQGAQLSIGNLLFFSLSTIALWNARLSAEARRPTPMPAPSTA
ncbi:hypothetical protein OHU11_36610 [Streptomyces sp. NBC_00257]|uniref:DUF6796 family protein n=1 Tax=unclassified Streptomyces TaxID=2593676 RepID=UPI002255FA85|nr:MULTISPECIES: DUF6796 family protein [unclassified Streptomyces]WTB52942.1 hypothetical protein OG832_07075 [Streptomyces sp. NBC_00826]WTH94167.1 hypothetical protein OIC43_36615 [Streptomyces sp. NBC_00825]WTI02902.1 hypothetical protein OHA23_36595 [Streptomyces sp. NBC_00822]MCX4868557.1 hypothetical protein [Streptomyces sp. NBC_00906]MCX4899796.1 hypothetical protein [Streptomyces sp. NBC_00892]